MTKPIDTNEIRHLFCAADGSDTLITTLCDEVDALQRRVEKMERVVSKARALSNTIGNPFAQHALLHAALPRLIDNLQAELEGLDAKEQYDAKG